MTELGFMTTQESEDGSPATFFLKPAVSNEDMLENMRSALGRGLPEVKPCKVHGHKLSVVGGGPSLEDTYKELDGYIAAVNGSQLWLKERDILPDACGILDPSDHMPDIIDADKRVRYFVGSIVHPSVFDKLEKAGCDVRLFHITGQPGGEEICKEANPDGWFMIGGGTTMGTRWINLG